VIASALWFIGLQLFVLKAVCPWCLVDHALGLAIGGLVFWSALDSRTRQRAPDRAAHPVREPAMRSTLFASGGVLLVAGLATAQLLGEYRPTQPTRLPAGVNADSGPGADRMVAVLDGTLQVAVHDVPALGSPDAPKLLIMLFDYCCPHCRATHGYLVDRLPRYSGQIGVVLLPTPLNSQCNPYWERTEPRFRHACELASLALAVWKVDRNAFPVFDAWLFEPETPRSAQEARLYAEQLVPAEALEAALGDPWIGKRIEQAAKAYRDSQAERIPLIMSPGMATVVGRPENADELFKLLESELGLKPATVLTSNDRQ
jgi:hypothetical protein